MYKDNFLLVVIGLSALASFGTSVYFSSQTLGYIEGIFTTLAVTGGTLGTWLLIWPALCIYEGIWIVPILSFGGYLVFFFTHLALKYKKHTIV